jgi:hypothetical protein
LWIFVHLPQNSFEMKKPIFLMMSLLASIMVWAQETVIVTFTANTVDGIYCPFNSVSATNVTRGWTETLVYPDTILVLTNTVGVNEHNDKAFYLGNAFPNPFTGETFAFLELPEKSDVALQVVRVDGSEVAIQRLSLDAGTYRLKVSLSTPNMAFLSVTTNYGHQVVKLVHTGHGTKDALDVDFVSTMTKSLDAAGSLKLDVTGEFEPGDVMRYEAQLIDGGVTIYSAPVTQSQYDDETITLLFALNLPTVTTNGVTDITQTTATCGGNVADGGGLMVIARGVCWSTMPDPTVNDSHTNDGTGIGGFTSNITGLMAGAPYYVRAYAVNRLGTSYGNEVNFTAPQLENYTISVSAEPAIGGTVTGGGTYQQGQSCTVTATENDGYTFLNWTEDGEAVSADTIYTFIVNGDKQLVANFEVVTTYPTGALNGLFTINENGDQVYFSQGNLQYQATTDTWRFAENQFDFVGNATQGNVFEGGIKSNNSNISPGYSGWIDLFGWGTSGWNCGNTYYYPWDFNDSDYTLYGPPGENNLMGDYAHSDWGVHNTISNGGNQAYLWRTLTKEEWIYVFNTRNTDSGVRYAKAEVNNVNGMILLPDDWNVMYYTLNNTNDVASSYNSNIISDAQWLILEQYGAVFLPVTGARQGTNVYDINVGYYWSSSCWNNRGAYNVYISNTSFMPSDYLGRPIGLSVRLVHEYDQ